jgi:hypothetical protein
MTEALNALVEAVLAGEQEPDEALAALDAAVDAAPSDVALRRLRMRLHEATWDRAAQVADLRVIVELDPSDRDAVLELARLEHHWAHRLVDDGDDEDDEEPVDDGDRDDEDEDEFEDDPEPSAADLAAEALRESAAARTLALAEAQLGDADWTERLLDGWTDLPVATNVTLRLRLALQARARHPQHLGLRRQEALAWADLATTVPTAEPPPGKPPMGVAVGAHGDLQDALATGRALAALAALPPEPALLDWQARLQLGLCRFDAAATAYEAAAAAWRARGDEGADAAAEADEQAARCRGGRAGLLEGVVGSFGAVLQQMEQDAAAQPERPDLPEEARAMLAQMKADSEARVAGLRAQVAEMKAALEPGTAAPDFASLDEQAEALAGHVLGAVALQPVPWVVHDGQDLDVRLSGAVPRWQATGLVQVGWAEAPHYTRQMGAPTVAGVWTTPESDALLVHVAVKHLESIDIETEFADGLQVVTSLGRGRNFLGGGPRIDTLHLDHDVDTAEMLAVHRARVALVMAAGGTLRPVRTVADFEGLQERQREAKTAYRLAEGLGEYEALGVPVEPLEHFAPRMQAAVRRRLAGLSRA